jgi:hypothetical protein
MVSSTDIMAMTAATISISQIAKSDAIPIPIDTPGKKKALAFAVALGVSFWLVFVKNGAAYDFEGAKYLGSAFISTYMSSKGLWDSVKGR